MWSKVKDEVCVWYYDGVTMYYTFMVWYYDVYYTFMVWYFGVDLWYYEKRICIGLAVFHGREWCRSVYFTVLLRYAKTRTWIQILIIVDIYPSLPWWIGQPLVWATMEMLPDPTGQLLALIDDEEMVMSDSPDSNSDADSEGDSPS